MGNGRLYTVLAIFLVLMEVLSQVSCKTFNHFEGYGHYPNPSKRSFASFRFRPKTLENLMMINTAYDMMDDINNLVAKNEDILSEEEREILREKAKQRTMRLLINIPSYEMEDYS